MHSTNSRSNRFLVVALVASLALTCALGCAGDEQSPSNLSLTGPEPTGGASNGTAFDGRDYYRGVFFGRGPVAERVPTLAAPAEIEALPAEKRAQIEQVQEDLLRAVAAYDAGYFDRLASAVNSGDRPELARMLDESALVTTLAIAQSEKFSAFSPGLIGSAAVEQLRATVANFGSPAAMTKDQIDAALRDFAGAVQPDATEIIGIVVFVWTACYHAVVLPGPLVVACDYQIDLYRYIDMVVYFEGAAKGQSTLRSEVIVERLASAFGAGG